jgi:hypothetical protein
MVLCVSIPALANGPARPDLLRDPVVAPPPADAPITSRFTLDGRTLEFSRGATFTAGGLFGAGRNNEPIAGATVIFDAQTDSSIVNGAGVRHQRAWVGQLRTVERTRTIETRRTVPVELLGFNLDLSLTGGCFLPGFPPGALCTFTPGMTVGPDDLDPQTLVPRQFRFDSAFGDEIDPRTHQALKDSPGFVRGDPDLDERVGISLEIPNSGSVPDEGRRALAGVDRREHSRHRLMFSLSRVDQTLRSTDREATLDRTIRGFVLLDKDEWDRYSIAAQLAAWVLPGMRGRVVSDGGAPSGVISNNLFLAANNMRLPSDSFTMFQTGVGRVTHPDRPARTPDETPAVFFNGVWLGVSPVRTTTVTSALRFRTTGERQISQSVFQQGGIGTPFRDVIGRVTIIDQIAQDISALELGNVEDLHVQVGIDFTRQEALEELVSRQRSDFRFVPHLSLSGNRTDGRSVVRYYGGVIDPRSVNFYVGGDFSWVRASGLRLSGAAIAYSRPDRDYFSNAQLGMSQTVQLSRSESLAFGLSLAMQFDRPELIADSPRLNNGSDRVEAFGQLRTGWGSFRVNGRALDVRNGDMRTAITLGMTIPLLEFGSLTFEVTPASSEDAFVQARVGASIPVTNGPNPVLLRAQYARIRYDFGRNVFGQRSRTHESTFLASLQATF